MPNFLSNSSFGGLVFGFPFFATFASWLLFRKRFFRILAVFSRSVLFESEASSGLFQHDLLPRLHVAGLIHESSSFRRA